MVGTVLRSLRPALAASGDAKNADVPGPAWQRCGSGVTRNRRRDEAVLTAHKRDEAISRWPPASRERSGWQESVRWSNKNARILWAVMTNRDAFDARDVSASPARSRPQHQPRPPRSEQRIHHAAGLSQKTQTTGQTGCGQARLTLGGLNHSMSTRQGMEPR